MSFLFRMKIRKTGFTILQGIFWERWAISAMRFQTMQSLGKECRHNIGYWTEVSYLGLGLGASSYMDGCRFSNEKDLRRYLALDLEHDCGEGLRELAGPVGAAFKRGPYGRIYVSGPSDDERGIGNGFRKTVRSENGNGLWSGDGTGLWPMVC